jgi:hypothetical protein
MKNLHKFYSKDDLPWVKLLWNKYYTNGKLPGQTMKGSIVLIHVSPRSQAMK